MKSVLTIAGSDSSGGAGIQADLKTFEAFGVFGCSALTVLTAQNTTGVSDIQEIEPQFVISQIEAVLSDIKPDAIKIGMLFSNPIIDAVRERLKTVDIPIVFDPVFISKAGSTLLQQEAVENLRTLFPLATLLTPNLYEANALFDYEKQEDFNSFAKQIPCPILVKNQAKDILYKDGESTTFTTPKVPTKNLHGTGCSFSSAIAANLALGYSLTDAIKHAKSFLHAALINAPSLGEGNGPIHHKKGGLACQNLVDSM